MRREECRGELSFSMPQGWVVAMVTTYMLISSFGNYWRMIVRTCGNARVRGHKRNHEIQRRNYSLFKCLCDEQDTSTKRSARQNWIQENGKTCEEIMANIFHNTIPRAFQSMNRHPAHTYLRESSKRPRFPDLRLKFIIFVQGTVRVFVRHLHEWWKKNSGECYKNSKWLRKSHSRSNCWAHTVFQLHLTTVRPPFSSSVSRLHQDLRFCVMFILFWKLKVSSSEQKETYENPASCPSFSVSSMWLFQLLMKHKE